MTRPATNATNETTMPRIKTNRGAAKRFKRRAGGGFKRAQSHRRHILTKKSAKRKRHLRTMENVAREDSGALERMMPYV